MQFKLLFFYVIIYKPVLSQYCNMIACLMCPYGTVFVFVVWGEMHCFIPGVVSLSRMRKEPCVLPGASNCLMASFLERFLKNHLQHTNHHFLSGLTH